MNHLTTRIIRSETLGGCGSSESRRGDFTFAVVRAQNAAAFAIGQHYCPVHTEVLWSGGGDYGQALQQCSVSLSSSSSIW
jgi:hypothetical protein